MAESDGAALMKQRTVGPCVTVPVDSHMESSQSIVGGMSCTLADMADSRNVRSSFPCLTLYILGANLPAPFEEVRAPPILAHR